LGGFMREWDKGRKEQEQTDHDWAVDFLNTSHCWDHVDKDTFLKPCARIYDQKEIEYVDKNNRKNLGITDKQVRGFLRNRENSAPGKLQNRYQVCVNITLIGSKLHDRCG
jgi:hypothetical protein